MIFKKISVAGMCIAATGLAFQVLILNPWHYEISKQITTQNNKLDLVTNHIEKAKVQNTEILKMIEENETKMLHLIQTFEEKINNLNVKSKEL